MRPWFGILTILLLLIVLEPALAQNHKTVPVRRKPVPVATIKDRATIKFFIDQFFIPETEVDSIDFIDIVGDGFNEKDMVQVYPSKEVYNLSPSDTAMAVMRQWRPISIRVVGQQDENGQVMVKHEYPAAEAMYAGLVRMIEKNYKGKRISLMFEYEGVAKTGDLSVWGYQESDLAQPNNPLEQFANDLLVYTRVDTVYVEKPVYDIIYIEHTETDSTVSALLQD